MLSSTLRKSVVSGFRCSKPPPSLLSYPFARPFSASAGNTEQGITKAIFEGLGDSAAEVKVTDISGGCGSMYNVQVTSQLFKGVSKVKQSRMVQDLIKKEIGEMHGLTLKTKVP
mmetsp:Transcript_19357/g.38681  ORF Transcript_19357/g.38681 Transcript_19357/m.38681 type:complete len:114 (-) Transcript_19357:62-403(-)